MTFIEGFLTPCPTANKDAYIKHAREAVPLFQRLGGTRFIEAWGEDVPDGTVNDLKQAVNLKEDETVLFSWIEYPDRATRDAANAKMGEEFDPSKMGEMPFDGSRMIFSGFDVISDEGPGGAPGFIDGVILPVPTDSRQSYVDFSQRVAGLFVEQGATRVVDAWGADVPDGKVTDYNRATHRKADETVVYSWIEWPSKQVRDAAWEKLMQDERMGPGPDRPFDGKRMMFGGFTPIVDTQS